MREEGSAYFSREEKTDYSSKTTVYQEFKKLLFVSFCGKNNGLAGGKTFVYLGVMCNFRPTTRRQDKTWQKYI